MHRLDGPRLKISRAKSEIERLAGVEDAFRQETQYRVIRAEFNPKSGKYVYRVRVSGPPPSDDWGIYIGEIAHNLRSALDHLVYQLALLQTEPKTVAADHRLQFPIFLLHRSSDKRKGTFDSKGKTMIKLLRPEHQALIERLQPYHAGSRPRREHPLYWLEEINNTDKHRLIQVVGIKAGIGPAVSYWGDQFAQPFTRSHFIILKNGAKIGEALPHMHVDANILPLVSFWKGCDPVKTRGVIYVLDLIAKQVSEIVDSFGSEFD